MLMIGLFLQYKDEDHAPIFKEDRVHNSKKRKRSKRTAISNITKNIVELISQI